MHHDEHGCADYGCADYGSADYGSASDSVSELPRSFIGISRFREIPIPAGAIIAIDHPTSTTITTRTRAHGTYTYCSHARMHMRMVTGGYVASCHSCSHTQTLSLSRTAGHARAA